MFIRILLVLSFCISGLLKAQNSLVLLTESGEKFWLYLNDQKINDSAQSIVKATKIWDDTCRLKVVYADKKLADFSATAYFLNHGRNCKDLEFTYTVEKIKDKYALTFVSTNLINTDSTSTHKQLSARVTNFAVSQKKEQDAANKLAENYPPPALCTKTISDSLLQIEIKKLKDDHIERYRIKDAKWLISKTCLSIAQTEKILSVFDYDDAKLILAEFGYDYVVDKENFMALEKSLRHKYEIEELKKFYIDKTTKQN
ncbi:MAG TPA: DUF4476 domain-containing protein [Bacteroidia bacterium]|nr:DUF4476 domain-containing protein [Bacteroidia bacterium]